MLLHEFLRVGPFNCLLLLSFLLLGLAIAGFSIRNLRRGDEVRLLPIVLVLSAPLLFAVYAVTVQFSIQPTGTVSGARATENTTGDSGMASCVVSVVRRLRWNPGPEGGSVSYRYPFVFAPQN